MSRDALTDADSVLVIGVGNPAREDDGIGPWIAERLEAAGCEAGRRQVTIEADYQLTVEDAAAVAEHDVVIFVDASVDGREPFSLDPVGPVRSESFSTHSVTPEAVLGLAHELFAAHTKGYVLAVRAYSFEMFTEQMTVGARANAERAVEYLRHFIRGTADDN